MADDQFILGGTGTEMFSGIPVSDFRTALDWYQRLFGAKPSFYPNEVEAVWAPIAEADDWSAFEAKVARVRLQGEAYDLPQ